MRTGRKQHVKGARSTTQNMFEDPANRLLAAEQPAQHPKQHCSSSHHHVTNQAALL
jgi:hypothetical protein